MQQNEKLRVGTYFHKSYGSIRVDYINGCECYVDFSNEPYDTKWLEPYDTKWLEGHLRRCGYEYINKDKFYIDL